MSSYNLISWLLFCFLSQTSFSQVKPGTELYDQILKADSLLFDAGFNNCNLDALSQVTDDSLKFYHDISGVTSGREEFIESIKNNICSIDYRPLRKLVPEEHAIYPLRQNGKIYGAIQNGTHEFYAVEENKKEYLTSTANFSNLWIKKEGQWKLQNVLSYNHQNPQEIGIPPRKDESIDQLLKKNKVPALGMAILKNGKLTQTEMYGELYDNHTAPLDAIFNVASLTKPIVTMLTLKLVENGDWDLDEPVYHYWTDPDVQSDPTHRLLTTRHILTHQSGFLNWRWENENNKLKFHFEPGKGYNYSGEGFEYLQRALEAKFDKPLETLADSLIFQPIGMKNTGFYWNDTLDEKKFARWHDAEGLNIYPIEKNKTASAADNLLTTIYDYGLFAQYVLEKASSGKELYNEMVARGNEKEIKTVMGLGWELLPDIKGEEYALLHTGGDKGVNTLIMLLPETGEGVVLFTNGDNGNKLYFQLIERNLSLGKEINKRAQ